MKNYLSEVAIFSAKATTGTALAYLIKDWQHIMLCLSSQTSANFTIKFQGSFSETAPDFSAAQSATNRWDYIQVKDYQNNAAIDGDTGIAFAGTDDVRLFELNTNGLKYVCATITARSAGSVNLHLSGFNNE